MKLRSQYWNFYPSLVLQNSVLLTACNKNLNKKIDVRVLARKGWRWHAIDIKNSEDKKGWRKHAIDIKNSKDKNTVVGFWEEDNQWRVFIGALELEVLVKLQEKCKRWLHLWALKIGVNEKVGELISRAQNYTNSG
jgi:hypothetical protein